jgi:hypothetical protein
MAVDPSSSVPPSVIRNNNPKSGKGATPLSSDAEPHEPSLEQRVATAFERLSSSASSLNAVSDELTKLVAIVDDRLKALNLGITAWVTVTNGGSADGHYEWNRSLGYAKVSGKWGIAIGSWGGYVYDEDKSEELWLFGDAPRSYRLEAVDKLPELIEKLVGTADETTEKLKQKIDTANQIAATIARSPAALKDAFLAEIRKGKPAFHNTLMSKIESLEITGDRVVFTPREPISPKVFDQIHENIDWLQELAARTCGRTMRVAIHSVKTDR